MRIPRQIGRSCLLALAATLVPAVHLTGATWDGPNNGDYATAANWNPDGVPISGDTDIASAAGITAIYSTPGNITSSGRLLIGSTGANTGTLTMQGSAGTLTFAGTPFNGANYIGVDGSTGTVNVNVGTLALTGMTNGAGHLHIGSNGGVSNGTLNIGGGTVNVGTRITMGVGYPGSDAINTVGNSGNGNATLTISAGSLNIGSSTVTDTDKGALYLKSPTGGTGSATVNLNGGTLNLTRFIIGGGGTSRTINFNGGTVQANATNTTFLPTGSTNNVTNSGGTIDTQAFNITMAGALKAATGSTTSAITKKGGGILTISGAGHTYVSTIVDAGRIDYTANDTYGNHVGSQHNLTINAGGLVTNSTVAGGFNTFQNLNLNGGELRATNTLSGGSGTFQAYHIRGTVTVGGTTASTISDMGQANGAINIGGTTDLGGGIGANAVFAVANATSSPAADLTVSAKLKNSANSVFAALQTGIDKTGSGTLALTRVNSYTGATNIQQGTLALVNAGSISTSTVINVSAGATLDVSATTSPWSLATGQSLVGNGSIAGDATIAGTVGPGNSLGSLGFADDLTLAGIASMEISAALSDADLITVAAALAFGGTLNVTNLGGTLVEGQSFDLFDFDFAQSSGIFSAVNLPSLDSGLEWNDSALYTTGVISVIPEPGTPALLASLAGLLALRRRRK